MASAFKIEGLMELDQALGDLAGIGQAKGVLRKVGREALEPFDQAWRANAPREDGHLAMSGGIGSKLTRSQRKAHRRTSTVEVFAGPGGHPSAVQQEFGNENHPAQPYVRPAWDQTAEVTLDRVAQGLGVEIERVAARNARKAARLLAKAAAG